MLAERLPDPFEEIISFSLLLLSDVSFDRGIVRHDALLFALGAPQERDGRAPAALARNRPLEAVLDHRADAVLAERRNPLDAVVNLGERLVADRVQVDEPLVRRAEDDGVLAAPAVGIGMGRGLLGEEDGARAIAIRPFRE